MKLKDTCSLEESYGQPRQHIKKQRHYFANKGPSSHSYGFSSNHVWMWELDYKESWVPKNWCFWTVVLEKTFFFFLRRLLRVPWTARRSNQAFLKEISPEYSLEGLMLKLKLQYFGHLIRRTDSLAKTLMLGKIQHGRRKGQQRTRSLMASPTQWKWVWVNSRFGDGQGGLVCCSPWGHKELDMTEWLNCTELMAVLVPGFKGISTLFSIVAVLVCTLTNSVRGFPFLHTLSSIYCL